MYNPQSIGLYTVSIFSLKLCEFLFTWRHHYVSIYIQLTCNVFIVYTVFHRMQSLMRGTSSNSSFWEFSIKKWYLSLRFLFFKTLTQTWEQPVKCSEPSLSTPLTISASHSAGCKLSRLNKPSVGNLLPTLLLVCMWLLRILNGSITIHMWYSRWASYSALTALRRSSLKIKVWSLTVSLMTSRQAAAMMSHGIYIYIGRCSFVLKYFHLGHLLGNNNAIL